MVCRTGRNRWLPARGMIGYANRMSRPPWRSAEFWETVTLQTLKVGIPKGSLQDSTFDLFKRAGFEMNLSSSRSYFPSVDDKELSCIMFRAQEMSRYVQDNIVDVGITGHDWIKENQSDVVEVCELVYSKATAKPSRWVLAVPRDSKITRPEDLDGGMVATELVGVTRRFFESKNVKVQVEFSWGATEVKARFLTGIVDITETGSSLEANNLRIVADILVTTPRLIASKQAWADPWKRSKIESIAMLLRGAIEGRSKIGMKMNVARRDLDAVIKILPAEKSPTVSALADSTFVAVEVILEDRVARNLIPCLRRAGASGIFTYPLHTVIP
jgi:ATP phosphoribosyltransferase